MSRGVMKDLPEGWKIVEFKHVAKFINGRAFKPIEWKDSGLPIVPEFE